MTYNIFISHSGRDASIIERLKALLESKGFSVWTYLTVTHATVIKEYEHCLRESQVLVVWGTPDTFQSTHCLNERRIMITIRLNEDNRRMSIYIVLPGTSDDELINNEDYIPPSDRDSNRIDARHIGANGVLDEDLGWIADQIEERITAGCPDIQRLGGTPLPFVICAMTAEEARSLWNGSAQCIDRRTLNSIKHDLRRRYNIRSIDSFYGERREEWRPLVCQVTGESITSIPSISHILQNVILQFNKDHGSKAGYIAYASRTDDMFNQNHPEHRNTIKSLSKGCILVMDALSLLHDDVYTVAQTLIGPQEDKIACLLLAPIESRALSVYSCIYTYLEQKFKMLWYRYAIDMEIKSELCIADDRTLKRWLTFIAPEIARTIHMNEQKEEERRREENIDIVKKHNASVVPLSSGTERRRGGRT